MSICVQRGGPVGGVSFSGPSQSALLQPQQSGCINYCSSRTPNPHVGLPQIAPQTADALTGMAEMLSESALVAVAAGKGHGARKAPARLGLRVSVREVRDALKGISMFERVLPEVPE